MGQQIAPAYLKTLTRHTVYTYFQVVGFLTFKHNHICCFFAKLKPYPMPKLKLATILCVIILAVILSCNKKDITHTVTPTDSSNQVPVNDDVKYVTTSVQGIVFKGFGERESGIVVTCGGKTTTTSKDGKFFLKDVRVNPNAAFIKAELNTSNSYLPTIHSFVVNDTNAVQYVEFTAEYYFDGYDPRFNAATGGTVHGPDLGPSTTFQPHQVLNTDGTFYNDEVTVHFHGYVQVSKPLDDNMEWNGLYRGITKQNKEVGLKNWYDLQLRMLDKTGQILHLDTSNGKTISISTPIFKDIPDSLPVWYLDEKSGFWKEEGIAKHIGDSLVFRTQHMGFLSFCEPIENEVEIKGTYRDTITGLPWPNISLIVTADDNTTRYVFTNNLGEFSFRIKANQHAVMHYSTASSCFVYPTVRFQDVNITSSKDLDLGIIHAASQPNEVYQFYGEVSDCNRVLIGTGTATAVIDSVHYEFPIVGGKYKMIIPLCGSPTSVSVYAESADGKISEMEPVDFSAFYNKNNMANVDLNICGLIPGQYVRFSLQGTDHLYRYPKDSIALVNQVIDNIHNPYNIWASTRSYRYLDELGLELDVSLPKVAGTYKTIFHYATSSNNVDQTIWLDTIQYNLTKPALNNGDYMEGTFSGKVHRDQSSDTSSVKGDFRVKREDYY